MTIPFNKMLELTKSGLVPFLKGPRGEGKTTYAKMFAAFLNITHEDEFRIMNLSCIEATDFCGMPYIDEKDGLSKYAKPSFLNCKFLLLDEVDRIRDSSVKTGLLSLFVDRTINGHKLLDDCILITAGNGQSVDGEDYDTVEFDSALSDRLITLEFKYSQEEKLDYFSKKFPENAFTKFLRLKPEILKAHSSRRIEAFLKVDNSFCGIMLSKEVARMFKNFIESSIVSIEDLKKGVYDFNALSAITKASLIEDIISGFYSFKKEDCKNLNTFVNLLRAEEKTIYFSKLKKLCLEKPDEFQKKAKEFDTYGLFKDQKSYLNELTK